MPLSSGADQNQTTSRILNKLQYAVTDVAADITTATTSDIMLMFDASDNYEPKYADATNVSELLGITASAAELNIMDGVTASTAELNIMDGVTATATEINKLDDSASVLTEGSGVASAETYASGVFKNGDITVTRIVIDMTGLVGSATDGDIIGDTGGAANAHIGQITAALSGTVVGGQVTCLEVPAGGADDVDLYAATEGTGAQDAAISTLTETALVSSGAAWTSGAVKGMTALPAANQYLYLVNGEAVGGTYTAGKFLIEFFGT